MVINPESLQVGSVLFTRNRTPVSWLIRAVLGFKYSHAAVYIGNEELLEAAWNGVTIAKPSKYLNDPNTYVEILNPIFSNNSAENLKMRRIFIETLRGKLGDYYDYTAILGALISRAIKRPRTLRGLFDFRANWFCTELIAYGLQKAGMMLKFHYSQVTPEDLYFQLKNS